MFSKNDVVELDIIETNNLGCGVGKKDGMVFFVKGAVDGDVVEAKIIKVNKSFCVGRLERILKPSENRIQTPFCDAPNACGGCVYRNVTYSHELKMKKLHVENAFRQVGLSSVNIEDVASTHETTGYRNKAQYPFGVSGGSVCTGFYANKTHDVISCYECALQPKAFAEISAFVCDFATSHKWSVYSEKSNSGILRHLYIREGRVSGDIMVCIVINADTLICEKEFCESLVSRFPNIKSLMVNVNKKNTNVILGDKYRVLHGDDYITDVLCGKRFKITAGSFYQVNHDGAELLYSIAKKKAELKENETLVDLYCGIGTIGISMSDSVSRLVGIEIVPEAVECAVENSRINGIKNAHFFCADAGKSEDVLSEAEKKLGSLSDAVIVVDPPRKGLGVELIDYLCRKGNEKIVYISCAPDTLARDCKIFAERGYEIGTVTPVDMFPRTGHVECVVCLKQST